MCGIAAAFNVPNATQIVSLMLRTLQDRGQEAAGILSTDRQRFFEKRGVGLVGEVFRQTDFDRELPGLNAIGHVRYPTSGDAYGIGNVQPFSALTPYGCVAVAHNGNLTNCPTIIQDLGLRTCDERDESDTRLLLRLLACSAGGDWVARFKRAFGVIEGAFALVSVAEDGTCLAAMDPYGFRPLSYVKFGDGWLVASETCAFDIFDCDGEPQQVMPGAIIDFSAGNLIAHQYARRLYTRHCSFCETYFARPDSFVFGSSPYCRRNTLGVALAQTCPGMADIVIPVPDSSLVMAKSYAATLGLPYEYGLIKSRYEQRTFIIPGNDQRVFRVRLKLNAVQPVIRGRHVLFVEDSKVRGTTSKHIVRLLRRTGAKSVHERVASPPVISSCHWGIDTPTREELIAHRLTSEEIRQQLGLDSLAYLPLEDFCLAFDDPNRTKYCYSCFTGELPVTEHAPPHGWT